MAEDVRTRIQEWDQGAWFLGALALALGPEREGLGESAAEVLDALGLATTPAEVEESTGVPVALLAAQVAAPVLQVASLLRDGTVTWDAMPDEALVAQGRASAQMVAAFRAGVLPQLPTLAEALERPSARILDVGAGVGLLALEFARVFPHVEVTAIDVLPRVLAIAERFRVEHPAGDRVELVECDVAALDRDGEFDLVWLPAPFIPRLVLEQGVSACARALRPGGWLMLAHGKFGSDPVEDALNRFKTACFGGSAVDDDEAARLVDAAGLDDLVRVPTPAGAPAIILGRRPPSSA